MEKPVIQRRVLSFKGKFVIQMGVLSFKAESCHSSGGLSFKGKFCRSNYISAASNFQAKITRRFAGRLPVFFGFALLVLAHRRLICNRSVTILGFLT